MAIPKNTREVLVTLGFKRLYKPGCPLYMHKDFVGWTFDFTGVKPRQIPRVMYQHGYEYGDSDRILKVKKVLGIRD